MFSPSAHILTRCLVILLLAAPYVGCAAVRRVRDKQLTGVDANVAVARDDVHRAALAVLPGFDLIPTSDYAAAGFIEARGDWGSPNEGAVVQISARADGDAMRVVVEAGRSVGISKTEMRALARAVLDRILAHLAEDATSGP